MNPQLIEQSRQLALPRREPIFLTLIRQELARSSAAPHEREPDESPGTSRN
jgi:hypothetical protein